MGEELFDALLLNAYKGNPKTYEDPKGWDAAIIVEGDHFNPKKIYLGGHYNDNLDGVWVLEKNIPLLKERYGGG